MRRSVLAVSSALALLTAGCVTTAKVMNSWVGHDDSDLVSKWGAPARSITLRDGKRVMTWQKLWTDQGGTRQVCEQNFTLSPAGTVVDWSTTNCPRW